MHHLIFFIVPAPFNLDVVEAVAVNVAVVLRNLLRRVRASGAMAVDAVALVTDFQFIHVQILSKEASTIRAGINRLMQPRAHLVAILSTRLIGIEMADRLLIVISLSGFRQVFPGFASADLHSFRTNPICPFSISSVPFA
jgi:hypothetical protein